MTNWRLCFVVILNVSQVWLMQMWATCSSKHLAVIFWFQVHSFMATLITYWIPYIGHIEEKLKDLRRGIRKWKSSSKHDNWSNFAMLLWTRRLENRQMMGGPDTQNLYE
jgi:hypothetical protein